MTQKFSAVARSLDENAAQPSVERLERLGAAPLATTLNTVAHVVAIVHKDNVTPA